MRKACTEAFHTLLRTSAQWRALWATGPLVKWPEFGWLVTCRCCHSSFIVRDMQEVKYAE